MKRAAILLSALVLVAAGVVGCAQQPTREQTGAVIGGVTGAAVGSTLEGKQRTAAIILGTMVGTMVGSAIGRHMDEQDRLHTAQALEYNQTGQPSVWKNPDSQRVYEVTPTRTYYESEGTPCREFTLDAQIGGGTEELYGTACRQADGSWKIVESR